GVFAAGAAVAGMSAAASAKPVPPAGLPSAAQAAAAFVSAHNEALFGGADEQYTQLGSVSSGNAHYVSYHRTFKGLPVIGGDFVVVTNNSGQVITTSVAQQHGIGAVSTNPSIS